MQISISGKWWKIEERDDVDHGDSYGHCDFDAKPGPTIRIQTNLPPKEKADTLIHEMLHAIYPDLSEESVNKAGTDIAIALNEMGLLKQGG